MIYIKSPEEIEIMKEGGKITAAALKAALAAVKPGAALEEIEKLANAKLSSLGAQAAFKRVEGYSYATCININEGVVHGIPGKRKIAEGDIVSVDLGAYYRGFNTDASWAVYAGDIKEAPAKKVTFLKAGEEALYEAIAAARVGNRVSDISAAMQAVIEAAGYSPVDVLVGHGVGRELHEEPQIPCLVLHGEGSKLKEGMTLAIEAIYTEGSPKLKVEPDGWTLSTEDGSLSAVFEHTVAVTKDGPIILTERD